MSQSTAHVSDAFTSLFGNHRGPVRPDRTDADTTDRSTIATNTLEPGGRRLSHLTGRVVEFVRARHIPPGYRPVLLSYVLAWGPVALANLRHL